MTIADHTTGLVATTLWGESVIVRRNSPNFSDTGVATDSWATVVTVNAELQPLAPGSLATVAIGEMRTSTHRFYFPDGTDILEGDRIRPSGWVAGDDEFVVTGVMDDEGHFEVYAQRVRGHG